MDKSSQDLLVVFIAIAAISILMQAGFTVAMFIGARKAQKKLMALADDVRLHAMPVIMSSREVIQDVAPKLKTITENLTATSTTLRAKAEQISNVVGDVTSKAHVQASRVDGMVKSTLDHLTLAVQALEHGVAAPVRQVNGIINGLRAGVDVMRKKTPSNHLNPEDDLFV
jgi:hypothetical protein